jgi:hypothetical protein
MTGSKHNREGNSGEGSEPGPGPYWKRMLVTGVSGWAQSSCLRRSRYISSAKT